MSFSFSVLAKSKDDARAQVAQHMADIAKVQDSHEVDKQAVSNVVSAYLDMVEGGEGESYSVSVSGSMGWTEHEGKRRYNSAGVNVSVRAYVPTETNKAA